MTRYHSHRQLFSCLAIWGCLSVALSRESMGSSATVKVGHASTFRLSAVDIQRLKASAAGTARLVVTVVGYTPPRDGSVQLVVALRCSGIDREVGRVAIFPNAEFAPTDVHKAQMFGLPLPDEPACRMATTAHIQLTATIGTGEGGAVTIGKVVIEGKT
jgi:hypothetical protein